MLRALIGFLCVCFSIPAHAKLGETVPQLTKRFGKSYTIESDAIGKMYKFRSEKLSVDVLVSNDVSVAETYFSDKPLTASGEPPNDIVRAILKTNVPQTRWVGMDAALFKADYALQSSDHEYIAVLRYTRPQPENSIWTMTVGRAQVVRSVSTATPSTPSPETTPLATAKAGNAPTASPHFPWSGLTPEEQALLNKGAVMEMYKPDEHSRHFITHIDAVADSQTRKTRKIENPEPVLCLVFGMEDAEAARKEGRSMAEFRYSRDQAHEFLFAQGWDKYHDRFFTRAYVQEGEDAYDEAMKKVEKPPFTSG
jgi:hypothetical protein